MLGACPSFVKKVIAYDLKKKIAAPVISAAMSGLLYKWEFVNPILFGSKQTHFLVSLHNNPALYKKHSFLHSKEVYQV